MSSKRLELLESLQLGVKQQLGMVPPHWLEAEDVLYQPLLSELPVAQDQIVPVKVQQELDSFVWHSRDDSSAALSQVLGERSAWLCYHLFSLVLT